MIITIGKHLIATTCPESMIHVSIAYIPNICCLMRCQIPVAFANCEVSDCFQPRFFLPPLVSGLVKLNKAHLTRLQIAYQK